MRFFCSKHGEVEAEPNLNYDVYCPLCVDGAVRDSLEDTIPPISRACDAPTLPSGIKAPLIPSRPL